MSVNGQRAPKILLYSHDSFGLGNIRRTLLLSETLAEAYPTAAILIVTGSPLIHAFRIPERLDYIKLPCLDRVAADRYEPRFLADWSDEVRLMRRSVLDRAVVGFAPDLMVVDKRPGGIDDELISSLAALRREHPSSRIVLGMRDILDEPVRTRRMFRRTHWLETVERYYDEVWVYGSQRVFDPVREYAFSASAAKKVRFCGYLGRPAVLPVTHSGPPRVLVMTGGGGDGSRMIEAYLEGLVRLPRVVALRSTVIFGPEMPSSARESLLERYGYLGDVDFRDFDPDPMLSLSRADVVVSMAGYNTVCELLSSEKAAILVPRSHPVEEQLVRARRLAEIGCVRMVDPKELDSELLMAEVLDLLERPHSTGAQLCLDGLDRVRERAHALLDGEHVDAA